MSNAERGGNAFKQEDKNQSGGRKDSKEDALNDSKVLKLEEPNDSMETKSLGGKRDGIVDKQEGLEQGHNIKDGAGKTPIIENGRKEDNEQSDSAGSNGSTNENEKTRTSEESHLGSVTSDSAAVTAPPQPTPTSSPENSAPLDLPTHSQTGVTPPLDMGSALEALTDFDDSTQVAVSNVFGLAENILEKLEQEQKGDVYDASADAQVDSADQKKETDRRNGKEEHGSKENNDKGNGKEDDCSTVDSGSLISEHNEKDGVAKTIAKATIDSKSVGGKNELSSHESTTEICYRWG